MIFTFGFFIFYVYFLCLFFYSILNPGFLTPIGKFSFYFKTIKNGVCVKKLISDDDAKVPFYESIMTRVDRDSSYKTVQEVTRGIFCTAKKAGPGKAENYIN